MPGNVRELKYVLDQPGKSAGKDVQGSMNGPENLLPDAFSVKEGKVFNESYLIAKALAITPSPFMSLIINFFNRIVPLSKALFAYMEFLFMISICILYIVYLSCRDMSCGLVFA